MQRHWDKALVMRGKSSIPVPLCKKTIIIKGFIYPFLNKLNFIK